MLQRWNKNMDMFRQFEREMDRFSKDMWSGRRGSGGVFPPIQVWDDGMVFTVRAELPGVKQEDLEVTAEGETLTIRGERRLEAAEEKANYHRRERSGGSFRRMLTLEQPIEADQVRAQFEAGVLTVTLPRRPELAPKKIAIESGGAE